NNRRESTIECDVNRKLGAQLLTLVPKFKLRRVGTNPHGLTTIHDATMQGCGGLCNIIILTACECTAHRSECYKNEFFYFHDFLELMKWISNQFWIVVKHVLINRGIVVRHAEKTCSTKPCWPNGFKDVFSVVRMAWTNNLVTI